MTKTKHLIIGSGTAGLTAAEEIRRHTREDEIKIVSAEDFSPYSPTVLPYLLSGRIDEKRIPMRRNGYFESIGTEFVPGKEVVGIHPREKQVVYRDGQQESYDRLLVASGAASSRPGIEGLDKHYFGFHTIADARTLLRGLEGKRDIAVLGGGLVGMEVALALAERRCRVTVIEREPRILPLYFDEGAEAIIRSVFEGRGVRLLTGHIVVAVSDDGGRSIMILTNGASVGSDMIVTCTGVDTRLGLIAGSGVAVDRGILVDRRMRTGVPDIYAAGDVAQAPDFFSGMPGLNQTVETAMDQGAVAGANMAGEDREYEGWISANIFSFWGNTAFSAGLSQPDAACQTLRETDGNQYRKVVFAGGRLVGAMFVNVEVDPGVMLYLMRRKVELDGLAEPLLREPKEISRSLMLEMEEKDSLPIQG